MDDKFKQNLSYLSALKYEPPSFNIENAGRIVERVNAQIAEDRLAEERHRKKVEKHLEAIENNTSELAMVTALLQQSVSHSEDMLRLYTEMHEIAAAKTPTEAESKYRKFMDNVDHLITDVESAKAIKKYATFLYQIGLQVFAGSMGG